METNNQKIGKIEITDITGKVIYSSEGQNFTGSNIDLTSQKKVFILLKLILKI